MSGMGKTTFGKHALERSTLHLESNPSAPRLSPLCNNIALLERSVHVVIACNNGNLADNYLSVIPEFEIPDHRIVVRKRGVGSKKSPMMIFVHFDEKGPEFLRQIIRAVVPCSSPLLMNEAARLVFFMTATMTPESRIIDMISIRSQYLNLELLDPDVVLRCLLETFLIHPQLTDASDPTTSNGRFGGSNCKILVLSHSFSTSSSPRSQTPNVRRLVFSRRYQMTQRSELAVSYPSRHHFFPMR